MRFLLKHPKFCFILGVSCYTFNNRLFLEVPCIRLTQNSSVQRAFWVSLWESSHSVSYACSIQSKAVRRCVHSEAYLAHVVDVGANAMIGREPN